MKKFFFAIAVFLTFIDFSYGQTEALWLRYPSISPDGNSIVFSYKGDLWKIASDGGLAMPLTMHEGHDFQPVWSNDGKQIAFASHRYGNFDVYVMPSSGGKANRLTYHSSSDYPSGFAPDNQSILFTSSRLDAASNQQFPSGVLPELYQISTNGGMPQQVITTPAQNATYSKDGTVMVFMIEKGMKMNLENIILHLLQEIFGNMKLRLENIQNSQISTGKIEILFLHLINNMSII